MEVDFEDMFKIPLTAMRINRSHPEIPRDLKWFFQFGFLQGLFTSTYLLLTYNIVIAVANVEYSDACRHGVLSVVYYVTSFQYLFLIWKQATLNKIIKMIKQDFINDHSLKGKMIVYENAIRGRRMCRWWTVLVIIIEVSFPLKQICLEIYLYATGAFKLIMVYPLILPSPLEEIKMQPFMYTLLYIVMLFYATYGAIMYISYVPMGVFMTLHACGQLEIVQMRTLKLFTHREENRKEKVIEIVKYLQYIYEFVDCIRDCYEVVYEFILKGCTILLPITVYEVISSFHSGEISIEFITFIIGGATLASLPCYYSDLLMYKGEELRLAVYSCGWEAHYDRSMRSTLLLILLRTARPISIRTMFRTICLETLAEVYQQAYTIFNLMNAAWE